MAIHIQLLLKPSFLLLLFCYFLLVIAAASLSNSSPQPGFVSERAKSCEGAEATEKTKGRERVAMVATGAGGRGGGDNGNGGQSGGEVIPVDTAAAATKRRLHKNGHHKGGCTKFKPMCLYLFLSLLLLL